MHLVDKKEPQYNHIHHTLTKIQNETNGDAKNAILYHPFFMKSW